MSVYWASGDLITNLQVLVVMVTGVVFAVNGQITLGEFMAFISYNASPDLAGAKPGKDYFRYE